MTHIRITQDATAEEVAALTTAIAAIAAAAPAVEPRGRRGSAWGRAGRLEQIGQGPFTSAVDPRLVHRPTGALPPVAQRSIA